MIDLTMRLYQLVCDLRRLYTSSWNGCAMSCRTASRCLADMTQGALISYSRNRSFPKQKCILESVVASHKGSDGKVTWQPMSSDTNE